MGNKNSSIRSRKVKVLLLGIIGILVLIGVSFFQTAQDVPQAQQVREGADRIRSIAHITDIHFDPYFDPTLVPQLLKADSAQWEKIFASSTVTGFGTIGTSETNYALLVNALKSLYENSKDADFIIFTGDFIAHDFDSTFATFAKNGESYSAFVDETFTFLAMMFNKYIPGKRIYFSLGNNDSDVGDYEIIPDGAFLHETADILSDRWIKDPFNQKSFNDTYPTGGYYSIMPLGIPGTRIISLNTNFFSAKYVNKVSFDPGAQQLDWLEKQLAQAQQNKEKVWLMYHIPPGANVYSSIGKKQYVPMWQQTYNDRFVGILKTYTSVLTAGFLGHTHMDDFRLLTQGQPQQAIVYFKIGPAISPQFGNNPGYQQMTFDPRAFTLLDYTVFYLNLDINPPSAAFQSEYSFGKTYSQTIITPATILSTYLSFNTDPARQKLYMNFYGVSVTNKPQMTTDTFKPYWCGIGNLVQADYSSCEGF